MFSAAVSVRIRFVRSEPDFTGAGPTGATGLAVGRAVDSAATTALSFAATLEGPPPLLPGGEERRCGCCCGWCSAEDAALGMGGTRGRVACVWRVITRESHAGGCE